MKKRKQHYVWQHYLRAWATAGQICCQRGGQRFRTATSNVANRRDFYRLREMSAADIRILELLVSRMTRPLQVLAMNWIRMFRFVFELKRVYERSGRRDPAIKRQIEETINNFEEDLHTSVENEAIPLLASLRRRDTRFLADDDAAVAFSRFIAAQYMRTPRVMRRTIESTTGEVPEFDIESAFGLMRTIFATNIGQGVYLRRRELRLTFLDVPSGLEFLTADQPIINVHAVGLPNGVAPEGLEFYYPLDPTRALLLSFGAPERVVEAVTLPADQVTAYNRMIVTMSDEQVYARSEHALELPPVTV